MSFELINERDIVLQDQKYIVRLYFDHDTNTQRHEYVLEDEVLYYLEYESHPFEEPEKNINFESIVNGFHNWYNQFGPDWRPKAF